VKASLQIAIDAARARRDTLDHILFFGPPGLGKTTLAMLMAREMACSSVPARPVLEKPGDLVGLLTGLAPETCSSSTRSSAAPHLEEYLYPAMEDYRVDVRIATAPTRRPFRWRSSTSP